MELILIIVVLVLLFGGGGDTGVAVEVIGDIKLLSERAPYWVGAIFLNSLKADVRAQAPRCRATCARHVQRASTHSANVFVQWPNDSPERRRPGTAVWLR